MKVRALPDARRSEVVELMADGTARIRLAAPPVEGKANEALADFLAEALGLRKSAVRLSKGGKSRDKIWEITGLSAEEVQTRLARPLP